MTPPLVRVADQRPLGLGERQHVDLASCSARLLLAGQVLAAAGQQVGRLGVRVVAQRRISSFGDSGLPVFQAGHCDWQRPHSVQVEKSSRPFQVKCSTCGDAELVLLRVGLLEVERLAVAHHRPQRAQGGAGPLGRFALEEDVEERQEAVPGHAHRHVQRR